MLRRMIVLAIAGLISLASLPGANASQGSGCMPTTGTVSGLTFAQDVNAAIAALISSNSGASAPATDCTAVAIKGQLWLDTSVTPNVLKQYDGTSWLILGSLDLTNHYWTPPVGGGTNSLASATTTDLWSVAQASITVSGTTTITGLANASAVPGTLKVVKFSAALTLTHNATSLIIPGGANVTTAAGDYALVVALTNTNVAVVAYTKADGTALIVPSNFTSAVYFNSVISPSALSGNTDDWAPTGLSTANTIRFSCSGAYNITGITAPSTDGKVLVLHNIGSTNPCTLTKDDGSTSTAGNRFALSYAHVIYPGQSAEIQYDLTTARWRLRTGQFGQAVAGGFKNLRVWNAPTILDAAPSTPNARMSIAADAVTLEDSSGLSYRANNVACTPNITLSGAGGLDTGSVTTDTWYSIWLIYNATSNTLSCMWSTSATSPTMPSGYTFKVRVGWNRTNGSSVLHRVIQIGRRAQYALVVGSATTTMPQIVSGAQGSVTVPTWQPLAISTFVPATAASIFIVPHVSNSSSNTIMVAPNNAYSGSNVNSANQLFNISTVTGATWGNWVIEMMLESTSIYYASNDAAAIILASGWIDNL